MNGLLEMFAGDGWAHVVQALLHTLWIGAVLAVGLAGVLRVAVRPHLRYRWCFGAMLGILVGGMVAWGGVTGTGGAESIGFRRPVG